MSRALLFLYLFAALFSAAPAWAEKRKDPKLPVPPPQPVAQAITVKRGDSINVKLSIYGRKSETLTYLIRTRPLSGQVGEPRAVSQEVSVVTYRPPADLAITRDRFTFAVQNKAGVSAPVEVDVTITDEAAQLITPDLIEFAPLLAGGAALKEMEITNLGGSICEGEVKAAEPWRIEGPTAYRLAGGARQKFLLFFEPKTAGLARGELRYTSQPTRVTTLRGTCDAAISPSPAELRLPVVSGSTVRAGQVELTNNTAEDQALTFTANPRLHAPASLTVPPHAKETINVSIDEGDPSAFEDALTIDGTGLQVRVPIHAVAVGPVLRLDQEVLRFPPIRQGHPVNLVLKVENTGGSDGFWKAVVLPPFVLEPASVRLRSREQKELKLTVAAEELGSYRGELRFEGEQQAKVARLEADVVAPATPTSTGSATPRPRGAEGTPDLAAARLAQADEANISALLYLRDHVKVRNIRFDGAQVEWPSALTTAKMCRIELRAMKLDDQGKLRTEWHPVPSSVVRLIDDRFFAELHGLRPGSINTIQIVPEAPEGETATPLFITQIETTPPKAPPFRITGWNIAVFLLVVAAGAGFAWKRLHRVEDEAGEWRKGPRA